jgi:hypothetical protein
MKERPPPGAIVRAIVEGVLRDGVVMHYETQWHGHTVPVRFDDGIWRMMLPSELEVVRLRGAEDRGG